MNYIFTRGDVFEAIITGIPIGINGDDIDISCIQRIIIVDVDVELQFDTGDWCSCILADISTYTSRTTINEVIIVITFTWCEEDRNIIIHTLGCIITIGIWWCGRMVIITHISI